MAKLPVGYRSPFKNKSSPMKVLDPMTTMALISAGGQILGGLIGGKARRREQADARRENIAARKAYMGIEYTNPYEGMQNPYTGMENPYAENVYEDLTVDRQAADYLREQQQQSQANIMQQMKGVAGGSGVAGLAQQMANVGTQQARQASATIAQQERQNQLYRLKGEQQKRKGTFEFDKMMRKSEFDLDYLQRTGQQKYVTAKEQARTENLFGLSIDRLSAADSARAAARSQVMSGIGQGIAAYGSTYMPGGVNYGALTPGSMHPNQTIYGPGGNPMSPAIYDPNYTPSGDYPWEQ